MHMHCMNDTCLMCMLSKATQRISIHGKMNNLKILLKNIHVQSFIFHSFDHNFLHLFLKNICSSCIFKSMQPECLNRKTTGNNNFLGLQTDRQTDRWVTDNLISTVHRVIKIKPQIQVCRKQCLPFVKEKYKYLHQSNCTRGSFLEEQISQPTGTWDPVIE